MTSLLTLVTSLRLSRLITISRDMTRTTTVVTRLGSTIATFIAVTRRTTSTITAHVSTLTTVITGLGSTIATIVAVTTTAVTFRTVTRHMTRLTARVTSGSISGSIGTITRLIFHTVSCHVYSVLKAKRQTYQVTGLLTLVTELFSTRFSTNKDKQNIRNHTCNPFLIHFYEIYQSLD